jgi:hypothetical protein
VSDDVAGANEVSWLRYALFIVRVGNNCHSNSCGESSGGLLRNRLHRWHVAFVLRRFPIRTVSAEIVATPVRDWRYRSDGDRNRTSSFTRAERFLSARVLARLVCRPLVVGRDGAPSSGSF